MEAEQHVATQGLEDLARHGTWMLDNILPGAYVRRITEDDVKAKSKMLVSCDSIQKIDCVLQWLDNEGIDWKKIENIWNDESKQDPQLYTVTWSTFNSTASAAPASAPSAPGSNGAAVPATHAGTSQSRMDDEALDRSQGESLPPMPDNPLTVFEKLLEEVGGGNNRTLMAQAADKLIPWLATAGEQLLKSVRILTLKARDKKRNEMEALQRKLKPAMFYTAGPVSTSRLEQLQGLSECMLCHTPVLLPESRSEHWPGGQLDYSEQLAFLLPKCFITWHTSTDLRTEES
eukprot:gene24486-29776_t